MNLADLSIRRPVFMSCIIVLSLVAGGLAMSKLGVDLFPDVAVPVVTVTTPFPGAGPSEVESLVSKVIEDEISTLAGVKRMESINQEGVSTVVIEFTLETDVKYAEQKVRDHVGAAKFKLPTDIKEPVIRRIDPAVQPVLVLSLEADLPPAQLHDLASETIRPRLEQVSQVGLVEVLGGRKREIQVQLDRQKLQRFELAAGWVATRLAGAGEDVPSGKEISGPKETVYRTVGQFKSLDDLNQQVINFFGNDVPVRLSDVGQVTDTLGDETSRVFVNGKPSLFINIYKQAGANTVKVVDDLKGRVEDINRNLQARSGGPKITVIRDGADWIRGNLADVKESILIGVVLAVLVVFLFLGNWRSTFITGMALPNSLLGAFILMAIAGFSINIMTLLALSLSVGLLIDDAIVVRENIFRHLEKGLPPEKAARIGTEEVKLAVIATTLTVIAVFGPLGLMNGIVGQFFKQFGLTICFAMAISLFDALTVAPMLSTYLAGHSKARAGSFYDRHVGNLLRKFSRFQDRLEDDYERFLRRTLQPKSGPMKLIAASVGVFFLCMATAAFVPKTFLPPQDNGEFTVRIDSPPGTSLNAMAEHAASVDSMIRLNREVAVTALTVGTNEGDPTKAEFYVQLVPSRVRKTTTSQFKEKLREQLKAHAQLNPKVQDFDPVGANLRPFTLNLTGENQRELEAMALVIAERLRKYPGLKDVDVGFRPGKPEFQIVPDRFKAQSFGTSSASIGLELRTQIQGTVAAKYREDGAEYDVRVRLKEGQRNLRENFETTFIPNMNGSMIRLTDVARPVSTDGPSRITRMDRNRFVQISADLAPRAGIGDVIDDVTKIMNEEIKLPKSMGHYFIGQAENFKELGQSVLIAILAGILFIYLVLASLYESFVTPLTIMLALPMAMCGSFFALFLFRESINIFSMIGMIMLLGVATKNSILLVDYAQQMVREGKDRFEAIVLAGRTRLRPILMTTMALVAGTIPIAMGLNEASRQRTSMGISILGGLVSSTLLTLIIVPASFAYIDRFRVWSHSVIRRTFSSSGPINLDREEPTR